MVRAECFCSAYPLEDGLVVAYRVAIMRSNSKAVSDKKSVPAPTLSAPDNATTLSPTAPMPVLSGQRSVEDKEWEERQQMRRDALSFDATAAAKVSEFRSENPKAQAWEAVQFYLKALRDNRDTLKNLEDAEKRQFARYELKDLPKLDNEDMAAVPLELMVSTTVALYSRFEACGSLPSDFSRAAAEEAWRVIHDCQAVLDEVERHRSLLNCWKNQDQVRLEYFATERTVPWAAGVQEITGYNPTDAPKRFRNFLEAYYGEVVWHEKQFIVSEVPFYFNANHLSPNDWVSQIEEFFRTRCFTKQEVAVLKKALARYVEVGIMPSKGAKDEKTTLRPNVRQQRPKA
jgi:hypothetical protein